jgi:hypothetical protein
MGHMDHDSVKARLFRPTRGEDERLDQILNFRQT